MRWVEKETELFAHSRIPAGGVAVFRSIDGVRSFIVVRQSQPLTQFPWDHPILLPLERHRFRFFLSSGINSSYWLSFTLCSLFTVIVFFILYLQLMASVGGLYRQSIDNAWAYSRHNTINAEFQQ